MLNFSEDFFEEEERLGFYIEPMMKKAWAVQLDVLSEVDRICNKYNLSYYAASGTMLGALRHKGYIPWDDDIDIAMKREDYDKFIKIAQSELPSNYYLHSIYTNAEHDCFHAAIMNGKDLRHGFPYVAGIDIFVLDYVPADDEEEFLYRTMFGFVYETARACRQLDEDEIKDKLEEIHRITGVEVKNDEQLQHNLWVLADQIAKMYGREEAKGITHIPYIVCRDTECYVSLECYDDISRMAFEMTTIPVPVGYGEVMTALYGKDYMTPIQIKGDHDYPFYAEQQKNNL